MKEFIFGKERRVHVGKQSRKYIVISLSRIRKLIELMKQGKIIQKLYTNSKAKQAA